MKKRKFIRKTTFFALMLAVLTVSLLTACKSKETVVSPADLTKEEKDAAAEQVRAKMGNPDEQTVCQAYVEEMPWKRFFGQGQHINMSSARNFAENQARNAARRSIETVIEGMQTEYSGIRNASTVSETASNINKNVEEKGQDIASSIANGSISNVVVVKSQNFIMANNEWRVEVCVEYTEDVPTMAAKIAKQVGEKLSDEEKIRIDYDYEKYKSELEEKLKQRREFNSY